MSDTRDASPSDVSGAEELSVKDLRAFIEVARTGSFRLAAANLYVSQPSVSRAIARLERDLGVVLLDRGPRGARPTAHGAALLDGSRRVLLGLADLRREVRRPGSGILRLGATATSARAILAPFLARWIPAHPEVEVRAIEDTETVLMQLVRSGECDAAVVSGPLDPAVLDSLRITAVPVVALFPPGHPGGGADGPVPVEELAGEPLLVNGMEFPSTALVTRELARLGLEPRFAYESSAGRTLSAMARTGLGVAVYGDAAGVDDDGLVARPVVDAAGEPISYELYVAWARQAAPAWLRECAVELSTSYLASRPAYQ